ncbi:MAG: cell cycle transcriptional regulator TrcR [Robiginitomaculum sp.]
MSKILMPKATAVWLIDNTALTFEQISIFCDLHILEVNGIADGDVAAGIRGADPISNGQVTRVELETAERDAKYQMKPVSYDHDPSRGSNKKTRRRVPRYTPLSRRQDRPDAIAWIVRNHPEITDAQISKLIGTTKPTIKSIRDRTHWKTATINPTDPVSLGLCRQLDLDEIVKKAANKLAKRQGETTKETGESLAPAQDAPTLGLESEAPAKEHTLESLFKPSEPNS